MRFFNLGLFPLLSLLPTAALAAPSTYDLLAPLPGLSTGVTLTAYLEGAVKVTIGMAGILAVLMIVICGVQMIGSPSVSQKSASKECITSALFGLLLAISSWLILNTINTQLLSSDIGLIALPTPEKPAPPPPPKDPPAPPPPPPAPGSKCVTYKYNRTACTYPAPPDCKVGIQEAGAWDADAKPTCENMRSVFEALEDITDVSPSCYETDCPK